MNGFPQLVPNRVAAVLRRLQAKIWESVGSCVVEVSDTRAVHVDWPEAKNLPRNPVSGPHYWGKLFDQRWCQLRFPTTLRASSPYYLQWVDQAEATLYVDGVPYYGFDVAHRRVALPLKFDELWVESICVQSAIWHPESTGIDPAGSRFSGAFLEVRDDVAWAAYHDLKCLFDVYLARRPEGPALKSFGFQPLATRCAPELRVLLEKLRDLCDTCEQQGAASLHASAAVVLRELAGSYPWVQAVLTGHAHIDLVWLWPEKVGEAKAVHTFATANRLMSLYPEFRFSYSQPASYEAVARRSPALSANIRRRMEEKQWAATGALYVESDPLLPCGEALARSFILGQLAFRELSGSASSVLWLPDVFGYPGCLPQMMCLSGVKYFFTTKLTWNAINRFPHSSFIWRGNDGSQVVAHVTQEGGYNNQLDVSEIVTAAEAHVQCGVHAEFLHPTGFGDGGGGTTEEMCERARRLNRLPGLPLLTWKHPEDFFQELEKRRERLPVHHGECYVEAHRGTYTTHGYLKLVFRQMERALQTREAVAVVLRRSPDLSTPWKRLIFTQFHDYIPGSSIIDVYRDGIVETEKWIRRLELEARQELDRDGIPCVFNPLPLPLETLHEGRPVLVPPLSGISLTDAEQVPATLVEIGPDWLSNGRVRVKFTEGGGLQSLVIDDEELPLGNGSGQLVCHLDSAAEFEAWDVDQHVRALYQPAYAPHEIERKSCPNGFWAEISFHRKVGQKSEAITRYRLHVEEPVIRVTIDLAWFESEKLLKYEINTRFSYGPVRCGAPFGTVFRSQTPTGNVAEAMWEMPASRHLTVTDEGGGRGLSVLTEAKYGFSVRDGVIGLTLLRSPRITGFDDRHASAYPRDLVRSLPDSIYSDQGNHSINFALAAYSALHPPQCLPAARAETLFQKAIPYHGRSLRPPGLVRVDFAPTLVPVWAVPDSDESWTLRLHEVGGERGRATVVLDKGWGVALVDFQGNPVGEQPQADTFEYRPNQIVSLRLSQCRNAQGAS